MCDSFYINKVSHFGLSLLDSFFFHGILPKTRIKGSKTLKNRGLLGRNFFKMAPKIPYEPKFLQFFPPDNQRDARKKKKR